MAPRPPDAGARDRRTPPGTLPNRCADTRYFPEAGRLSFRRGMTATGR